MKKICTALLFFLTAAACHAQLYERLQNGPRLDAFNAVTATPDGGALLAGYTNYKYTYPFVKAASLITKVDGSGNVQWTKAFFNNREQFITSVVLTNDGGFAAGGYMENPQGDSVSMFIMKCTGNGHISWIKYYKSPNYILQLPVLIHTKDDGFVLGCSVYITSYAEAACIIKTGSNGNILWSKEFLQLVGHVKINSLEETKNGHLAIVVSGPSNYLFGTDSEIYFLNTDANGNASRAVYAGVVRNYKGVTHFDDYAAFVHECSDGGFVFGGFSSSPAEVQHAEPFIIKVDAAGKKIWSKLVPNDSSYHIVKAISEAADSSFFLTGYGSMNKGYVYPYFLHIKKDGSFIQSNLFNSAGEPVTVNGASRINKGKIIAAGKSGLYSTAVTDIEKAFFMSYDIKNGSCGSVSAGESVSLDSGYVKPITIAVQDFPVTEIYGADKIYPNGLSISDICVISPEKSAAEKTAVSVPAALVVFPSVAASQVYIRITGNAAIKGPVKIFDGQGNMVKSIEAGQHFLYGNLKADISGLHNGSFYVTCNTDNGILKTSFIKEQ